MPVRRAVADRRSASSCSPLSRWRPRAAPIIPVPMLSPAEFVDTHRPAGGRRSGKRDLIVDLFLREAGHLTADELVALVRRTDRRISRATIYRTLQWMVEAGIARRVDFGGGKYKFETAYR